MDSIEKRSADVVEFLNRYRTEESLEIKAQLTSQIIDLAAQGVTPEVDDLILDTITISQKSHGGFTVAEITKAYFSEAEIAAGVPQKTAAKTFFDKVVQFDKVPEEVETRFTVQQLLEKYGSTPKGSTQYLDRVFDEYEQEYSILTNGIPEETFLFKGIGKEAKPIGCVQDIVYNIGVGHTNQLLYARIRTAEGEAVFDSAGELICDLYISINPKVLFVDTRVAPTEYKERMDSYADFIRSPFALTEDDLIG